MLFLNLQRVFYNTQLREIDKIILGASMPVHLEGVAREWVVLVQDGRFSLRDLLRFPHDEYIVQEPRPVPRASL